ncbi:hypothetical protein OAU43_03400 [Gammaproteobacteria bacterium]|nr:hypothetical protein [Gammaproteobacteria bacterium]
MRIVDKDKLNYRLENILSSGSFSTIIALSIVVILLIVFLSLLVWIFGSNPGQSFADQLWIYFNTGFGRSAMNGSWIYRLTSFILVIVSIFFSSIIIGSIASEINSKIIALRQGKTKVIESGHTIILGWSESLYIIINELIEANSNQSSSCIVILGNKNNEEMHDHLNGKVNYDKKTRIILRSGSPSSPEDLSKLSTGNAKSIIINIDDDIEVVKTILAVFKNKKVESRKIPIACKISDSENLPVAMIAGKGLVKFLPIYNFIGRIDAQACLQPGIAEVLLELLDFAGSEIYFHTEERLIDKTYKEAVLSYDTSCVVGILKNEVVTINPPHNSVITESDKLIVIALDDDQIDIIDDKDIIFSNNKSDTSETRVPESPKNLHILGWNNAAPIILHDLIGYLPPHSTITISSRSSEVEDYLGQQELASDISVNNFVGDIRDKEFLESTNIHTATNVLLLSSNFYDDHESADAATLFSLINLREIRKQSDADFTILSEVLNSSNSDLISIEKSDDFVMSERIVNLMLAQLSENPDLDAFFNELMQPEGSEIYFKRVSEYTDVSKKVKFGDICVSALEKSETAIGYRINNQSNMNSEKFGININPRKSDNILFSDVDEVIVFSDS